MKLFERFSGCKDYYGIFRTLQEKTLKEAIGCSLLQGIKPQTVG